MQIHWIYIYIYIYIYIRHKKFSSANFDKSDEEY